MCADPYAGPWITAVPVTHPTFACQEDPWSVIVDNQRVRALVIAVLAACGGTVAPPPRPRTKAVVGDGATTPTNARDRPLVEPIAALAITDRVSRLAPGTAQLELHATPIEGPGPATPLEVSVLDAQGNLVRVAIRLEHARFAVWTERARLLGVVLRDERVSARAGGGGMPNDKQVLLRQGAAVKRLARKDGWTQIRYAGALEVEGWLPDVVLGEAAPAHDSIGRIPSGARTLMVTPGAVIRAEPRWAGRQLAVMANGYFVDTVRDVDAAWVEVFYQDGDLVVTGYVSRRDPPGRLRSKRADPTLAPAPIAPTTRVASGTCLFARSDGDPIGYLVGDQDVDLADATRGWWSLAIDTPWGPVAFAARGADASSLQACGPTGSVPASTLVAPPATVP
ncbi:MAG: hypothetical protein JWP01_2466 [Myxococcales bacterium]|nr:hypothetical protein [Myxococcales bacterium]